jgi:hypothetical protein
MGCWFSKLRALSSECLGAWLALYATLVLRNNSWMWLNCRFDYNKIFLSARFEALLATVCSGDFSRVVQSTSCGDCPRLHYQGLIWQMSRLSWRLCAVKSPHASSQQVAETVSVSIIRGWYDKCRGSLGDCMQWRLLTRPVNKLRRLSPSLSSGADMTNVTALNCSSAIRWASI